jgi:hypothetical protein
MSDESDKAPAPASWYRQPKILAVVLVALLIVGGMVFVLLGSDPDEAPIPDEHLLEDPDTTVDPEQEGEPDRPVDPDFERED